MHTVAELVGFAEDADRAGMSDDELQRLIGRLARDPLAGNMIPDTGGARKVRAAGRGKGKSGGYRIITYFAGYDVPVFLVTAYSKGMRADLPPAERRAIKVALADVADAYRDGVRRWVRLHRIS